MAHAVWLTPDPKVYFSFPPPAEPGQLMFLFTYGFSAVSFLLRPRGADTSLWFLPLPAQSTQTKPCDQRILQYKQSLRALLSSLKLPVFDDEKPLSVLTSGNELFENIMVIYLVRLKGRCRFPIC